MPCDWGKVIEKDQLQPIETNFGNRAKGLPETTSITNLLKTFQSEWDAVLPWRPIPEEKFTAQETRQQLSQALYQNDAANRVIGRLLKEEHIPPTVDPAVSPLHSQVAMAKMTTMGKLRRLIWKLIKAITQPVESPLRKTLSLPFVSFRRRFCQRSRKIIRYQTTTPRPTLVSVC